MTTTPALPPLAGVIPPVCTPLTADGDVDVASLERLVGHLLTAGVHGLFPLGSTGEVAFLTDEQRRQVVDTVSRVAAGQVPVVAGVIDMTTPRVLPHIRQAESAGADAVVVTAPFYTRTHPVEIAAHFRIIAASTALPVIAYDIPVSVHSKLSPSLVLELAEEGVLAGIKDSSGDDAGIRGLVLGAKTFTDRFSVLTGSELTVDAALAFGAQGVVPGLGNVDPDGYVRLWDAAQAGDTATAAREQERLFTLFDLVNAGDTARMGPASSALGAFKAALHLRGIIDCPRTADPYVQLDDSEVDHVRARLAAAGLL
ncbi:4-hydroxy-tetrahydrodipicolinate synthase [Curtobacterium sp. PhB130]|uniref:dihydrodipicolinate synthase family protein n=1 Tax=unclassified Curtobacterium TaxID=257496 RepID=UPI000F944CFC|nr:MULTISPECIES: dihydrodipicolinate synthase family protein [unclassified Curtobacterium]ROP61170.1 4-hydroxy-tetrahydrodipicolinate synthase [Curtobacterium sp. ZW137]ROS75719.1 4-hydroxy-tetrahydrodipicolinate synthase [Curtobacterium sp. PhB130]